MTRIFLLSREIAFTALIKLNSKEKNGLKKQDIRIPLYKIPPSQSLLDNLYRERRAAKELFYISKEDENQYINDVALLRSVTMREQGRVLPDDITEEEEGISSSESDPEPDLNKDGDLYPHRAQKKKSRSGQQTENAGIVLREHTTRSGQISSVKLPLGLQRDGTQI